MERKDPAFADYNYNSLINEISMTIQQYLDSLYAPFKLKGIQHALLTIICRNPGISQKDLLQWFTIDASNITRNLAYLEQLQFITRNQSETDKRNRLLFPTEKAISSYDDICRIYVSVMEKLTKGFTDDERAELSSFLTRMKDNLNE